MHQSSCARLWLLSSSLVLLAVACGPKADDVADAETGATDTSSETTTSETETSTGDGGLVCEGEACNPLLNDCADGELCIFFNTEFQCFPSTGDGSGVAGATCETATFCNEGLACIQGVFFSDCAGDACCAPNCAVDDPNSCPPGQVCDQWFEGQDNTDPCYVDVGVCISM